MQHVPYRGSAPLVTDLLAGQVQSAFDNLPASIEHIRSGKLRALAVGTETRSDQLPNVPTLGEFLPDFEASAFVAIGAPNNTPTEIIGRLNHEINAGLADPKIKARLAELGGTAFVGSPADFSKLIADETEKWAQGDPGRQHQAGVIPPRRSVTPVPRSAEPHPRCRSDQIQRRNLIRCDGHRKRSSCALYRSDFRTIQL